VRARFALLVCLIAMALPACREPGEPPTTTVDLWEGDPPGAAIAYSGYRDGQSPKSGILPSRDQVAEDLRLLARNWRLVRVYAPDRHGEDVLEVIRHEKIELKVMLGIWLDREPGAEQDNASQIADGIRLANQYEDIVVAVNVGNEVLIEWTEHPVPEKRVIRYVREVRAAVTQPVTVADNYVWWRDHGADLAREVDFITMHTYPLWERKDIDEGLSFTVENFEEVRAAHPGRTIVIGEAGWATYTEGNLHVPRGGDESKQQRYYEELTDWARKNEITLFFFEAFDEAWKGSGTEGHWGLFTAGREAKPAIRALYPDRSPNSRTSPDYPDRIAASGPDITAALHSGLAAAIRGGSINPLGPGIAESGVVSVDGAGGGDALRLVFSGESWSGVYFLLGRYDASAAGFLRMRIALPEEVARLELKLEGPADNEQSVNLMDYAASRDGTGWTTITIPLTEFDSIDLSEISVLGFWNPSDRTAKFLAGEVLFDDIRFE
jgi:exo-beta-1,3-glucanase (GH17 family)